MDSVGPAVLWRLEHPRGARARAVVLPGSRQTTLTFFVGDVMDRAENYETMEIAVFRADDVKRTLLAEGWQEKP